MTNIEIYEILQRQGLTLHAQGNPDADAYIMAAFYVRLSTNRLAINDRCPNCKKHLRKPVDKMMLNGKRYHRNGDAFCSRCGQAITWEVKNSE